MLLIVTRFSAAGLLVLAAGASASAGAGPSPVGAPQAAAQRMSQAGKEEAELQEQAGDWNVVASLWPSPNAQPIVTRGLVAHRTMIGPFLHEVMQPEPGSPGPDFRRLDYLNFDRVEGRWKYVSMDTRFPVSIMPAWSFGPAHTSEITLQFEPQAFVGFGPQVEGRFMVSSLTISQPGPGRMLKEQRVAMADGTGRSWVLARYEYNRRR